MLDQIEKSYAKITDKLRDWLDAIITMLPNLVVAVLVTIIFLLFGRFLRRLFRKTLRSISRNEAVNILISNLLFFGVFIAGLFIALGILNLDKTVVSLLAGLGILGLAIGFAFKDVAANFLAGIYMAIKSPINIGDMIAYEENYGTVKEIGMRASTITTLQGQDVVIPNRLIIENIYTHFTINGSRRIDLSVGISYGDDLEKVETVTLEAVQQIDSLQEGKPVDLYYNEFGNSSINFNVRYWIEFRKETDYLMALSQGIKNIKKAYDENDITITFPIRTLDFGIKGGKTLAEMLVNGLPGNTPDDKSGNTPDDKSGNNPAGNSGNNPAGNSGIR
jgi:small conductance mechanosensitive channel